VGYLSDSENQPLSIAAENDATGNFTGGNAANSMDVTAFYMIIDV
jgi:hypothetical protein